MSETSSGKTSDTANTGDTHDGDKMSKELDKARLRAAELVKTRREGSRPRTEDGTPVKYTALKSSVDPKDARNSRSFSDPLVPGNLVIYDTKGLFGDEAHVLNGGEEDKKSKNGIAEERPKFFDPFLQNKACGTNTLRTRFEAIQMAPHVRGDGYLMHFQNPLHNSNMRFNTDPEEHSSGKETETPPELPPKLGKSTITKPLPELPKKPLPEIPKTHLPESSIKSPPEVPKKPSPKVAKKPEICKKPEIPKKTEVAKKPLLPKKLKKSNSEETDTSDVGVKGEQVGKVRGQSDPLPLAATVSMVTSASPVVAPALSPVVETQEEDCQIDDEGSDDHKLSHGSSQNGVCKPDDEKHGDDVISDVNDVGEGHANKTGDDKREGRDSDNEPVGEPSDFDDESGEDEQERRVSFETPDLVFPDSRSKKLYNIALEILTTERAYVRRLHLLDQVFYTQLDTECRAKGLIPLEALNTIFANIKAIHQLHKDFLLPKLEDRMKQWNKDNRIGDILKTLAPFLKLYTDYIGNFDKASEAIGIWMKKSSKFAAVIEEIQKTSECENLTLHHHMLEPIQRVPRYKMLLTDYLSKLPEDSPDMKDAKDALGIISESAVHANESMKRTERFKKLLDIQEKLGENFGVVCASREFVKEGDLFKVSARTGIHHQPRTLILFSDVLLCCAKVPATNKYKVKVSMDVYGMEVCSLDDDVEDENTFRVSSKQKVIDFTAGSQEEQQEWVGCLQKIISEQEQKKNSYRRANKLEVIIDSELGKKAPAWVRDESVSMCMLCDMIFTALRRRHHCRACGGVLCGKCSQFRAPLEYDGGKQNRVCSNCYKVLVKGAKDEEDAGKPKDILKIDRQSNVQVSGYLNYKHGEKSWQKRWFVLLDNFVLYCHKAKKDTKAEFSLPLPGYTVGKPTLADDVDKKFVFKLHHKNIRVYFFEGEDENAVKRWMNFLSFAIRAEQFNENEEKKEQENTKEADEVDVSVT